jgi:hypothetical protein
MHKITIKKNLIIFHRAGDWFDIYSAILRDYGMGMAVRTKLRRELGFTYRNHQEWIVFDRSGDRERKYCEEQVHLDFYSEAAQSWFILRYIKSNTQVVQN